MNPDHYAREAYARALKLSVERDVHRFAGELRPGAVVIYTGKALRSMGARFGAVARARFVVVACACELCQLGRHICVERPNGRHIARSAVRAEAAGEHYLDEGSPEEATKDMFDIQKGGRIAAKDPRCLIAPKKANRPMRSKHWQDCKPFVRALVAREYIVDGRPVMSYGTYLYLYELWQDGTRAGALAYKKHVAKHPKAEGASPHRKGHRRDDAA